MEKLTVAQRRMVIDYYATKLVEEWPAVIEGIGIENRLHMGAVKLEWRLNKFVNKITFSNLIWFMLDQQSFDRDPQGWLHENGHEDSAQQVLATKEYHEDMISALINDIAGV